MKGQCAVQGRAQEAFLFKHARVPPAWSGLFDRPCDGNKSINIGPMGRPRGANGAPRNTRIGLWSPAALGQPRAWGH